MPAFSSGWYDGPWQNHPCDLPNLKSLALANAEILKQTLNFWGAPQLKAMPTFLLHARMPIGKTSHL